MNFCFIFLYLFRRSSSSGYIEEVLGLFSTVKTFYRFLKGRVLKKSSYKI